MTHGGKLMKRIVRSNLSVKCAALIMLVLSSVCAGAAQAQKSSPESLTASSRDDAAAVWQKRIFDEEEISFSTPVPPTTIVELGERVLFPRSKEKTLEERNYSGYSNGFIFAIDSYKVKNPQRLLQDLHDSVPADLRYEREVALDGLKGKQYQMSQTDDRRTNYHEQVYYLAAARHVYVITLAVNDKANRSPTRFLSSLRGGNKKDVAEANAAPMKKPDAAVALSGGMLVPHASNQEQIFRPSEVTRKAAMVWRPEPRYTEEARRNQVQGTVVLRGIFDSSGYLTNLIVKSGLPHGLTEKAVEAAHSVRFFPAIKDGKFVSQYIQIEYNFNLY
jgi:TonB family protein